MVLRALLRRRYGEVPRCIHCYSVYNPRKVDESLVCSTRCARAYLAHR